MVKISLNTYERIQHLEACQLHTSLIVKIENQSVSGFDLYGFFEDSEKDLFEKLIAFGKKHNILIVNDNPYSFVLNDNPLSILQVEGSKDIALELNSLSKTYNMAGWRVGMVLGNPTLIDAILKVKSNMDSGMFFGIQKGAIAALKSDKSWFDSMNAVYKKRRILFRRVY